MRTARDATDDELLAVLVQIKPLMAERGGTLDPTDAIVAAAVITEAHQRGLIGPEPFLS